jgi:hypothetical protein
MVSLTYSIGVMGWPSIGEPCVALCVVHQFSCLSRSVPNEATPIDNASNNGSGPTTMPAPAFQPSSTVIDRVGSPPIRRLAPLPTSAPTRPAESLRVGPLRVDAVPFESIESSTRSTTRAVPKGIAKNALPVKVVDVPVYLLGEGMKKDRYDWKNRVIIELGDPNYKGAFAQKGPEGKWKAAGLQLHIYDAGENNPPALPKEFHRDLLKEKVVDPTGKMNQAMERASAPAENNRTGSPVLAEQTKPSIHRGENLSGILESLACRKTSSSALPSQRSVCPENTIEYNHARTSQQCNSAQQSAPQFHSSTVSAANGTSVSARQLKQHVPNRKEPASPTSFTPITLLSKGNKAHISRTVAPVRPSRGQHLPEEPCLLSAHPSAPSTYYSPRPLSTKSEPESKPALAPSPGSIPEMVRPQPSSRTTSQSEPTRSLPRIAFDSSFCSGSSATKGLSDLARGFLRGYVRAALPFSLLTSERFFVYLDSTQKERIADGYSEDAIMSWQFNDLPSVGVCPQVGNPQAQGHQITEVPRWVGRNLLLRASQTLLHDILTEHHNCFEQEIGRVVSCAERQTSSNAWKLWRT